MSLGDYLHAVRRHLLLVVVPTLLGALAAVALVFGSAPQYHAHADLFVTSTGATAQSAAQANAFIVSQIPLFQSLATAPTVTGNVTEINNLGLTSAELADKITTSTGLGSAVLRVQVSDASAAKAALLSNLVAARLKWVITNMETSSTGVTSMRVSILNLDSAVRAVRSPSRGVLLGGGLAAGLVLGLALAIARAALDTTFDDVDQLAAACESTPLGAVSGPGSGIAVRSDPHGPAAMSYRLLRATVRHGAHTGSRPARVLAVVSAERSEGRTSTALNLAAAIAEAGERVCLLEADLQHPTLRDALGLRGSVGLTSVLAGSASAEQARQPVGNLSVLAAGPQSSNPSALLAGAGFRELVRKLAQSVDVVVIDTPPVLEAADAAEVAAVADATLLVVRARHTKQREVTAALQVLKRTHTVPLGVVLTGAGRRGKPARSTGAPPDLVDEPAPAAVVPEVKEAEVKEAEAKEAAPSAEAGPRWSIPPRALAAPDQPPSV